MSKRVIILREKSTKLSIHDEYILVNSIYNNLVISFSHIEKIYLNKSIQIDINTCYAISKKVPLFIIDHHGYIIAQLKRLKDA